MLHFTQEKLRLEGSLYESEVSAKLKIRLCKLYVYLEK